jgi:hypothetical protein
MHTRKPKAICLFFPFLLLASCVRQNPPRGSAGGDQAVALDLPICVHISSAAAYTFRQTTGRHWPLSPVTKNLEDDRDIRFGTAFCVQGAAQRYLCTAAHVVARSTQEVQTILSANYPGTLTVEGQHVRIRVSSLAFPPAGVFIDWEHDIAFIAMPSAFWRDVPLRAATFTRTPARIGEPASAWGFPSTTIPQLKNRSDHLCQ